MWTITGMAVWLHSQGKGGIADTMRKKYCYSQLFQHNCVTDSFISRQQFMVLSILKLRVFPMK